MSDEVQPEEMLNSMYAEQFDQYSQLYPNAPVINSCFELTNAEAFEYCVRRKYFVIIAPYNKNHEIIAERTFAEENIKWSLIGGSLNTYSTETFLEAANRLAQYALPAIKISDIEPFAFLVNTFSFENNNCVHHGIAFTGRIRSNKPEKLLLTGERTRVHFVPNSLSPNEIAVSHNRKVFIEALKHVSNKTFGEAPFHEREISINEQFQHRYAAHDTFIKPIFNIASKFYGEYSIKEYKQLERSLLTKERTSSLIDVACGENDLCENLSRDSQFNLVVGNDISFSQIELLSKRAGAGSNPTNLIYTNHDATDMPFNDCQFDVAICKNVLHHMPNQKAVEKLIAETVRISKRALIVEVMNPEFEGRWGRLRHNYYVHFLQDAYVHFVSKAEFDELISPYRCQYRFDCRTFRGVYFLAVLNK
jgi:ubiquinone/menaquinone biosynthesis C-methylase UbiE